MSNASLKKEDHNYLIQDKDTITKCQVRSQAADTDADAATLNPLFPDLLLLVTTENAGKNDAIRLLRLVDGNREAIGCHLQLQCIH